MANKRVQRSTGVFVAVLACRLVLCAAEEPTVMAPVRIPREKPTPDCRRAGGDRRLRCIRVAIVGGGAGGSAAAAFLREQFPDRVEIDVFDENLRFGGRADYWKHYGSAHELGAAVFLEANKYMKGFADRLGLAVGPPSSRAFPMSVWDEDLRAFTFQQTGWKVIDLAKFLYRFGMTRFGKLRSVIGDAVDRWVTTYDLQAKGVAFESVEDWLSHIGLYKYTQHGIHDLFEADDKDSLLFRELVAGIMRNTNNQAYDEMNALSVLISMSPLASGSPVLCVAEGNAEVMRKLVAKNRLIARPYTKVLKISTTKDTDAQDDTSRRYTLRLKSSDPHMRHAAEQEEQFDVVIVAAPLESAGLEWGGTLSPPHVPRRDYRETHVTIVRGKPRPEFFGLPTGAAVPPSVLFAKAKTEHFLSSYGTWGEFDNDDKLVKLFSSKAVSDDFLRKMFSRTEDVVRRKWYSVPRFTVPEKFAPTRLFGNDHQVYYVNAVENAASAMEVSMVWAKNIALLAKPYIHQQLKLRRTPKSPTNSKARGESAGSKDEL